MLGEERALLLAESHDADARGAILDSDDARESSLDGETEMVNPLDSGDESDGEQEESSGRSELQGANAAYEGGSGGEPESVGRNEGDGNSMLEQLGTEVVSIVEQGKGLELEVRVVACAEEAHGQSGAGAPEQKNSETEDEIACVHANNSPCQENSVADEPQDRGSEENKDKDLETNEEERREQADVTASEDLEVADEAKEEGPVPPPEYENVSIPLHWHPKPCVQIAGLGGSVSQEELVSLITKHAPVASIVFENDKRDAVIVRLQASPTEEDEVVSAVREALNNMHFKDKTLVVEPFRPDSLLFIGNLTPEIDDELLKQMFEPHGRIERAFVLRNEEGRSKGYGFVEYSLKSQASTAKQIMGNINMDGRVLRVEWSDCRKVADMFSTVLFVDRIAKECPNIESILKTLFGEFGKVRDCHLAIGMSQQFRGFAFIDFNHSTYADKAHEALDGKEVEASNIRVSFANPSKSAQSYKSRFGSQGTLGGLPARGFPGVMPAMMGAALRSHMAMPFLAPRFLGPRPGMLGMGIGMQFGSGAPIGPGMIGRGLAGPLLGAGGGMLGPRCIAGMMGRAPGLLLGPVPISPAAIAQVATAQAKAREEEAKARAEFRRLQQAAQQAQTVKQPGQNLYQQQQAQQGINPEGNYSYQQVYQQMKQQPYTPQPTPQQHQEPARLSYTSSYYPQSGQQQYMQQPSQPQLQAAYYQHQPQSSGQIPSTAQQQYIQYSQQYNQQQTQQYTLQQYGQVYDQTTTQSSAQQYTQYQQPTVQRQYTQQEYDEYYAQQQQHVQQGTAAAPIVSTSSTVKTQAQDVGHQQVYAAYYQQQAQLPAAQALPPVNQTATTTAGPQETLEAQWAAYYAAQQASDQNGLANGCEQQGAYGEQAYNGTAATAAYHQQPATADLGQKRSADHLDYASQNQQNAYGHHQHPATSMVTYQQQTTATDAVYQQQTGSNMTSYQQAATSIGYQHQNASAVYTAGYQQPATSTLPTFQQPSSSYYLQPVGAYQQPSQETPVLATLSEFSKRPRY